MSKAQLMEPMNPEGLTYKEWYAAATKGGEFRPNEWDRSCMRKEWAEGVDPTEWFTYLSRLHNPENYYAK